MWLHKVCFCPALFLEYDAYRRAFILGLQRGSFSKTTQGAPEEAANLITSSSSDCNTSWIILIQRVLHLRWKGQCQLLTPWRVRRWKILYIRFWSLPQGRSPDLNFKCSDSRCWTLKNVDIGVLWFRETQCKTRQLLLAEPNPIQETPPISRIWIKTSVSKSKTKVSGQGKSLPKSHPQFWRSLQIWRLFQSWQLFLHCPSAPQKPLLWKPKCL